MTEPCPESTAPQASAPTDAFAAVPEPLRTALRERGFTALTAVQEAALAAADGGRDLRITSQTGSGKTVALGLAMAPGLQAATDGRADGPLALVIVPTRELAQQVRGELAWLFAGLGGRSGPGIACVTGGTGIQGERKALARRPAVVVGTPGRLLDHLRAGALSLTAIRELVLDEADQMLDLGFREELDAILEGVPAERRTHLVSATLPPAVRELADRFQRLPLHLQGTTLGVANADIEHIGHLLQRGERYGALINLLLLAEGERTLVFVRTRQDSADLAEQLAGDGFAAAPISGDLAQAQRTRTLEAFRAGVTTVLVATDVAARGLDIADVTRVVHFDPPIDGEVYTHRSGRTGRAGRKGQSVLLAQAGRRRAERLCRAARVTLHWQPAPTADAVRAAQAERTRAKVRAALAAAALAEAQADFAAELLAERPAVEVVAALLDLAAGDRRAAPREVQGASLDAPEWRPAASRPATPRPFGHGHRAVPHFTRFAINWGLRAGASPQRILAHVCRRGAVPSRAIGSIELGPDATTFEVASELAREFADRVRGRDRRDPHVRIRMLD